MRESRNQRRKEKVEKKGENKVRRLKNKGEGK
jgi:hypothetical protein